MSQERTITAEQIDSWKRQHKQVFEITVEDAVCYLRKPTRQELSAASSLAAKDPMGFSEQLLEACWLGGDECIKTDDELFLSVVPHLSALVETKQAELKKI